MSRRDDLHLPARRALEKDGWIVTDDPFPLFLFGVWLKADLAAEKTFAAEKAGSKIAVEVKDFDGDSPTSDLEKTMGQLQLYQWALVEQEPEREMFLAISEEAYYKHFLKPLFRAVVERNRINLIVFDHEQEVIVQWLKPQSTKTS